MGSVPERSRSLELICLILRMVILDSLHDDWLTLPGAVGKGASFAAQIVNSGKLTGNGQCKYGLSPAELQAAACKDGGAGIPAAPAGKGKGKLGKGGKAGKAPKGFSCPPKGDAAPASKPVPKAVGTAPKEAAPSPKTAPKEAAPSPKSAPKEATPSPKSAPKTAAPPAEAEPTEAEPTDAEPEAAPAEVDAE
jgi:hypothetical protein